MKINLHRANYKLASRLTLITCLCFSLLTVSAQEDTAAAKEESTETESEAPVRVKPVKNTFQSVWIIDNQTVMVPAKGTLEMDIMHRFGVINKGYKDLWGFFAPSNIRLVIHFAGNDELVEE